MNFFVPRKRYGQNFLTDRNIVRKIISALSLSRKDHVLEIGPGRGALTFGILGHVRGLTAVEVDRDLHQELKEKIGSSKNIHLVCQDILRFDLKKHAQKNKIRKFKVVGNLPYCITTPILEFFFKYIDYIADIFITVQKEVADRMTAQVRTEAYGSLTCFVNYFCSPEALSRIKRGSFWPAPEVDSCFLRLKVKCPVLRKGLVRSEALLMKVLRAGFGQRRKKLYSALATIVPKRDLERAVPRGFLERRAEELALDDFIRMSNLIFDFF